MNNSEKSISQMILDQQLLSAYRNGGSLYFPSVGVLSPTPEVASLTLTDTYLLQALMPSMTPQEQWLTSLELLKNTVYPSVTPFAHSSAASSTNDVIRELGRNSLNNALLLNNATSTILAPEHSFIQNGQIRLGSMMSSGFGSLLPYNTSTVSNSIKSVASQMLEESNRQALPMLLNALSAASIGNPLEDEHMMLSNALNLIEKRQAEACLSSEQSKKKTRLIETTHPIDANDRNTKISKSSSTIQKHKKKSGAIKKCDKDSVLLDSETSPTYEDAQLLFDTFVTLASAETSKLKSCSAVSVDSERTMLKYEEFASDSELTSPKFWDDVPYILSISMAQMSLTRIEPNGTLVHVPNTTGSELGHAALCCKHCNAMIGFGSHFFKSLRQGNHIHRIMKHVHDDCTACPLKVRGAVKKLCDPINSSSLGLTLSKSFKSEAFFEYIWNQLCVAGFQSMEKCDTDTDTVTTDDTSAVRVME